LSDATAVSLKQHLRLLDLAGIKDRCEQAPVVAELSVIGSYRFFLA
jgi:hypothetical protein